MMALNFICLGPAQFVSVLTTIRVDCRVFINEQMTQQSIRQIKQIPGGLGENRGLPIERLHQIENRVTDSEARANARARPEQWIAYANVWQESIKSGRALLRLQDGGGETQHTIWYNAQRRATPIINRFCQKAMRQRTAQRRHQCERIDLRRRLTVDCSIGICKCQCNS